MDLVIFYIFGFYTINALIKFVTISFLTSLFFIFAYNMKTKEKENSSPFI